MDAIAAARLQEEFYRAAYSNDLAGLLLATSKVFVQSLQYHLYMLFKI